ncbi:hypothetical protein GCM10010428_17230 [Actinosynnema pretiosum subsp. pretiosum]
MDTALAEGRITADDYRKRRDELLAGAASNPQPSQPPQQPAQPSDPFGQPFHWGQQQQQPPQNPDATQVVLGQNQGGNPNPDATQVVKNNGGNASERTQVVRPVTPPHGQPQMGGWTGGPGPQQPQQGGGNPPWTGGMYSQEQAPSWIAQGPEVFEDSSSGGSKRVLMIVGGVVLLAAIGFGVWFFLNNSGDGGGNNQAGGDSSSSSTPTTTTPPKSPDEQFLDEIPQLLVRKDAESGVLTPTEIGAKKVLTEPEVALLTEAKVEKVGWRSAGKTPAFDNKGSELHQALVIKAADEETASGLVEQFLANQRSNGFINIKEPLPGMPASVSFDKRVVADAAVYRGIYTSGSNVVLVEVTQTPLVEEAALSGSYQNQLKALLEKFPAVQ